MNKWGAFAVCVGTMTSVASAETYKTVYNPWTQKLDYTTVVTSGTLPGGSTQYIQNRTSPQADPSSANISSMTIRDELNTSSICFQNKNGIFKAADKTAVFSMPDNFTSYFGYSSAINPTQGGVFSSCNAPYCMLFQAGGNFNYCAGTFCMGDNVISSAEQNNCIGYACLAGLTSGTFNQCDGGSCLHSLSTQSDNSCNGAVCLTNTVSSNNTCGGSSCGKLNTTGSRLVGLGKNSGWSTVATSTPQLTGDDMIYIGVETTPGAATPVYRSAILGNSGIVSSSSTLAASFNNFALVLSTPPALSSCGASPTVTGSNSAFTVSAGAGATACTATFSQTFVRAPTCTATPRTGSVLNAFSYAVTNAALTVTETGLGGTVFDAICIGDK